MQFRCCSARNSRPRIALYNILRNNKTMQAIFGKIFRCSAIFNCDAHNPQSSPTAMPAPLTLRPSLSQAARREKLLVVLMSLATQGAYIKFVVIAKVKLCSTIISSLKGKVAASFSEQTEGLRYLIATHKQPLFQHQKGPCSAILTYVARTSNSAHNINPQHHCYTAA